MDHARARESLSLTGSVAPGTGVMIGAGILALGGQVDELAGGLMPRALFAGAVVADFSAYSYIRNSASTPSSGGIAMLLEAAYGLAVIAGSFSLLMYVSMILAESLLGRNRGDLDPDLDPETVVTTLVAPLVLTPLVPVRSLRQGVRLDGFRPGLKIGLGRPDGLIDLPQVVDRPSRPGRYC